MKSLLVTFPNVICRPRDISSFRGEINQILDNADDYFHNHDKGGFIYRYPVIQYRSVNGKAAIFAINKGASRLLQLLNSEYLPSKYTEEYEIKNTTHEVSMLSVPKVYRLAYYVPFDSNNYTKYKNEESLSGRVALLEQVSKGHILNFCTAVDFKVPHKSLKVTIKSLDLERGQFIKSAKTLCFSITFTTNIKLPENIGLGRAKAKGYGVLNEVFKKNNNSIKTVHSDFMKE